MSEELYDNILNPSVDDFLKNITPETKERILKDNLKKRIDDMIAWLTNNFIDVCWSYEWDQDDGAPGMSGYGYNRLSLQENYQGDADYDNKILYQIPFTKLRVKLTYAWQRRCNLNHVHTTERFHVYPVATINNMSYYYKASKPKEFIKEYFEDFFY